MQENKPQDLASKIESIFNFEQTLPPTTIEESVSAFENTSNQLVNIPTSEIKTIEDKEYIDGIFKTMIDSGTVAFKRITETIKVGASGKDVEGYARFFDSLSMTLERLVNYKIKIRDLELMANPEMNKPQTNIQNNTFNFEGSSSELLDTVSKMVKKAKDESQMTNIEAKFNTEEH